MGRHWFADQHLEIAKSDFVPKQTICTKDRKQLSAKYLDVVEKIQTGRSES